MTTDENIGLLAWVMMKEYPEDAARRAVLRAEACASLGDAEMGAKWRRIAAAIRKIRPEPS